MATLAICLAALAAPHPHRGILEKYERQQPSRYGLVVDSDDIRARLRSGKAVVNKEDLPNGFRRTSAIKDVDAPADLVYEQIIDVASYPQKIDGVLATELYSDTRSLSGTRSFCALYRVRFATFIAQSYVRHECDPLKRCMTFHLDYDHKSDVSDQVGYWYVESLRGDRSRVYYSAMATVPVWVPKFAHGAILDLAAKRATSWVEVESCKEYASRARGWDRLRSRAALVKARLQQDGN